MLLDLLIVTTTMCVLEVLFGHFETYTASWKRLLKLTIIFVGVGALSYFFGHSAGLGFFFGIGLLGGTVHFIWCRKHEIDPWRATPADRYYKLRGWQTPPGFRVAAD